MTSDPAADVRAARRNGRRCIAVALELLELERQLPLAEGAPLPSAMALKMRDWFHDRVEQLERLHGRVPEPPATIHPRPKPRPPSDLERARENLEALRGGRRG